MSTQLSVDKKRSDFLRFFASDTPSQSAFLGGLPASHEEAGFEQHPNVIRFRKLVHRFMECIAAAKLSPGSLTEQEEDMAYILDLQLAEPYPEPFWSNEGLQYHSVWRMLRLLAADSLARRGLAVGPPGAALDDLIQ